MLNISLVGDHDEVSAGSALITFVEPHDGHAVAYNRWYERDHFYSGVVMGPWVLGGRRYVAPRMLKAMRYASGEQAATVNKGSYLAVYLLQAAHKADFLAWGGAQLAWLRDKPHRMNPHRDHLFGSTHDIRWTLTPQEDDFPAHLATQRCFPGLLLVMGDVLDGVEASQVDRWHRECLRQTPPSASWGLTLAFNPGSGTFVSTFPISGTDRRFVHLHFLDADPLTTGVPGFEAYRAALEESKLARITFMSPFVPTVPGTDRYADDL